jgi:hypothetical protein
MPKKAPAKKKAAATPHGVSLQPNRYRVTAVLENGSTLTTGVEAADEGAASAIARAKLAYYGHDVSSIKHVVESNRGLILCHW